MDQAARAGGSVAELTARVGRRWRCCAVRFANIVLVAALAAFAFVVTYDNIVDYNSNYEFVRHVLSMDTTFPDNALMHRAITDPRLWTRGLHHHHRDWRP